MATPDKDAAQLVRKGISLYRPAHAGDAAEIYDEKKVCEKWSLTSPVQMIEYLALAGDTADNIPGIRGVGEKTAVQLLSQFGDIEGIIANASSIKGKLGEKVASGAEDARISKFLTTIRTDVPLSFDWESCKRDGVDAEKLAAVCAKYELNKLAGEMLSDASVAVESTNDPDESSLSDITSTPHDYRIVKTEDEAESLLAELMQHKKVAFDTETDSVDAHTCKLVGFSFAVEGGKAWYVEGSLIDIFRPLFSDASKTLVGHNVKFDRTVLQRYGIGMASHPHDTMLAHYCLDAAARHGMDALARRYLSYRTIPIEKLIGEKERGKTQLSMAALKPEEILDYAAEDADVTLKLDEVLRPLVAEAGASTALEKSEEPLIKILIGMERAGVKIDVAALKEYGRELDKEILSCAQTIHSYADPGFNPDSPKQLGELLFGKLKLDPLSARRTQTGQYSTDEKTLSKLVGLHPVVQAVLDYRACSKLKSTYVDKLPTLIDADGRVHTTYSQAFTETGRLSSADPNLQNIPIRTERGKMIRKAFVSRDDGHVLVSADYSQIELRIMAALSKDEAMLQAFRDGVDIHRETASRVYGVMSAFVTDEQRSKCKMVNFGIIYGISAFGLSQRLKVSRKEATSLIEAYFRLYPGVKRYMDEAVRSAREKGYAETILGRRRTLKDINSRNATIRQAAERDAMNTPIQGSAADLIKLAMVRVDAAIKAAGLKAQMVLQIHDELVFDVPLAEVDTLKEIVRREMSGAYDFGVPLEVGIGSGKNWLEAH
jgi:DNA polymerase-1